MTYHRSNTRREQHLPLELRPLLSHPNLLPSMRLFPVAIF